MIKSNSEFMLLSERAPLGEGIVTGGLIKVSVSRFWIEKPTLDPPNGYFFS